MIYNIFNIYHIINMYILGSSRQRIKRIIRILEHSCQNIPIFLTGPKEKRERLLGF